MSTPHRRLPHHVKQIIFGAATVTVIGLMLTFSGVLPSTTEPPPVKAEPSPTPTVPYIPIDRPCDHIDWSPMTALTRDEIVFDQGMVRIVDEIDRSFECLTAAKRENNSMFRFSVARIDIGGDSEVAKELFQEAVEHYGEDSIVSPFQGWEKSAVALNDELLGVAALTDNLLIRVEVYPKSPAWDGITVADEQFQEFAESVIYHMKDLLAV